MLFDALMFYWLSDYSKSEIFKELSSFSIALTRFHDLAEVGSFHATFKSVVCLAIYSSEKKIDKISGVLPIFFMEAVPGFHNIRSRA